ncbi:MAG: tRNA pseudouridine(38-40) synthase TruA, partial [Oscillospiraceae bacterium]
CFDGTAYHGFQMQQNALSICQVVQDAIEKVLGVRQDIKPCSRTDTGVHANGFCFSMFMEKNIPCEKLPLALNVYLPRDIRVLKAEKVADDFHARYSSLGKRYIYKVKIANIDTPFDDKYVYRMYKPLDVKAMEQSAKFLVGSHDFASFMSAGSKIVDSVREIYRFTVCQKDDIIYFTVSANGFLYNQMRIMVGTLIEVGTHRMEIAKVGEILCGKNRSLAGDKIPAKGLFLDKVFYNTKDIETEKLNF